MAKRMLLPVTAILVLLLGGADTWTQGKPNPAPQFTHVSEWGVPRAQWGEIAKVNTDAKALLDSLLADGTIVGYGFYEYRIHSEGGFTHGSWFQATSIANILKTLDALMARPAAAAPVLAASKHRDFLMISNNYGSRTVNSATGYIRIHSREIKPEALDEFLHTYHHYVVPMYEKLLADGTILAYQLDTEFVVQNAPGRIFSVVITRDAEGLDKVNRANEEMHAQNPAVTAALTLLPAVPGSRMDLLGRVTALTHK